MQSSSESSDAHHILELVEQLDEDEDERQVTVVVMAASTDDGLSKYLLHLIAGHLTEPVVRPSDELWKEIQTHYVGNDALYDAITKRCEDVLINVRPEKRTIVLENGPHFVVTTSFPIKSIDGEFKLSNVIEAKVVQSREDRQRDVYVFEAEGNLSLRLHEPRSPMTAEYSSNNGTAQSKIEVSEVC